MILNEFSYIAVPPRTGGLEEDVCALLEANGKDKTFRHVRDVAGANAAIAAQYGLDAEKCRAAALLHDISAVIRPADMLAWAQARGYALCEAELQHPFLLHQRLSRVIAETWFGVADGEILSPIECHTTLKPNAAPGDMALFIADKLAWDQEGRPPFYDAVSEALGRSLEAASLAYMGFMEESGLLLCPHSLWIAAKQWLRGR